MRYVRCRECGSTEVPTLATCPNCGIKTPIEIRQRWWLLVVALGVGAGAGFAVGYPAFSRSGRIQGLEARVEALKAEAQAKSDRAGETLGRLDALRRANAALRERVVQLERRRPAAPIKRPVPVAADDRLRVAHVHWTAAYQSVSRLWRVPYVPFGHVQEMDREVATLEACTRQFTGSLSAAPENDFSRTAAPALAGLGRHLASLRQAVRPDRWQRITVSAQSDWGAGDIEVGVGDLVYLSAEGGWTMSVAPSAEQEPAPAVEPVPLVGALPLGAVLWRVSGSDRTHALLPGGASATARAEAAGDLQFRINEQHLDDNAGAVAVHVIVLPARLIAGLDAVGLQLIGG